MTGRVEGGDWWVERMDDDCECTEGEGVMIGGGSGGAEGEEACGSDVGEGGVGGVEREVGKGEKSENEKGEWGDTCVVVVASVSSSSAALGESASVGREESCWWRSGPGGVGFVATFSRGPGA